MLTRGLREAAFEEFKVTRQTSTGNGALYCAQVGLSKEPSVPGWFVRDELGYDGPVGTRLYRMTPQSALEAAHREAARDEGVPAPEASPRKQKRIRETPASRRAKLHQIKARALAMRYAA
ncbi:MAG TPA: hypothetical protein VIA18_28260 [Polyangia bacterium]|jgi:hypothetical protein|nr:hypothetical protein [Polyangia bacterium]